MFAADAELESRPRLAPTLHGYGDQIADAFLDGAARLLGQEGLARLGAIMAVDGEGVLRGVVTVDAVRRALQGAVTV